MKTTNDDPCPDWNELRTIPTCSEDNCPHYDGKRCLLMGFEPDNICEPAVQQLSEAVQVVLANLKGMKKSDVQQWLLSGLAMTKSEFDDIGS